MSRAATAVDEQAIDTSDYYIDPIEGRRQFDELARAWVGMSGDGFIRRYDAGEFATIPDDEAHRGHIELALMIPFGRAPDSPA